MSSLVRRGTHLLLELRHWARTRVWHPLASGRGQGTVEYVGIVILVGALLIALKAGMGDKGGTIAHKISTSVSNAIQDVMDSKKGTGS
jgi:hypothetical protein